MHSAKVRLRDILRRTSLQSREDPIFRLASGKMSRYYVDCKQALDSFPLTRRKVDGVVSSLRDFQNRRWLQRLLLFILSSASRW